MENSVGQLTWDSWINATACVSHTVLSWVSQYVTDLNTQKKQLSRGGRVLPYKRLMGMCRWMESHFHDWIEYNGVAFSIVPRVGSHIFGFFGVRQFFILTVSKRTRIFVYCRWKVKCSSFNQKNGSIHKKKKVTNSGSRKLHICPKVTKLGSIIGHRIDYNGVGALRGQRISWFEREL